MLKSQKGILPIIIFSQFFCTSLWFAGNAVMSDLILNFGIKQHALGYVSSAVQLGFIIGALIFAILCFADRYSPSKVFFICALLAAISNLGIVWSGNTLFSILLFRFFTGFFLAGIYPVGMKIASDYFEVGLGKSLGYLVGALVLGTALPHLLKNFSQLLDCNAVLLTTSILAVLGGLLMLLFVPNGPYRRMGSKPDFSAFFTVFKNNKFRAAAFGYFGHMWELYAFWTFVPVILLTYQELNENVDFSISMMSFLVIASGTLSCCFSGHLAERFGIKQVAFSALALSFLCCILSPLIFHAGVISFIAFMIFWGMVVIADSPLFSAMVALNADSEYKGTGLTIVTCVGFAITILSIQLLNEINDSGDFECLYMLLAIGPLFGLMALRKAKL